MIVSQAKKIDKEGRITLPLAFTEELDWDTNDTLLVSKTRNILIVEMLEKSRIPNCVFCSAPRRYVSVGGKDICRVCHQAIKDWMLT